MRRSLNHRQIEAFRAAMRFGSATAAADALHITQPAASRLIADFERQIGFTLFERRKRGLQPTKDGMTLYEEVRRSFRGLDRIAETAEAIRSRRIGHLRVISMHTYTDSVVSYALGRFLANNPDIRVELETAAKDAVLDGVINENYDVGVATLPLNDSNIKIDIIDSHAGVCILPLAHRLAGRKTIRVNELEGEPFLTVPLGSPFRAFIDHYFSKNGVKLTIVAEARTQRALYNMVAAGAGVAIVDSMVATDSSKQVVAISTLKPTLAWSICALTSRRRSPSHALQALLTELGISTRSR